MRDSAHPPAPAGTPPSAEYVEHRWMQHALNLRDIVLRAYHTDDTAGSVAMEVRRHEALLLPSPAGTPREPVKAAMAVRINTMHAALSEVLALVERDENVRFNLSKPPGTFLDGESMATVSLSYGLLMRVKHALSEAACSAVPDAGEVSE